MNRSGLFFLVFTSILALGFTWLNSTWLSYKDFNFSQKDKIVDYYLSNFTLLNTYPDGQMRYLVKGQHLIHQQSSGSSQIFNPVIQARDSDNGIISITAKHAQQNKKNGPILLNDTVDIVKKSNKPKTDFKLLTSNLTYNPVKKELSSEDEITLTSDLGSIKGVGFNTNLNEEELRIYKNVQAVLIPAK
jgi:LPS export ABC transporter protein LptC